jgi:hypothetical protein
MNDFLQSETVLTAIAAVLGALWTLFKSSDWFERLRQRRFFMAVQAMEAAVEDTYRAYVRSIKKGRADGKLTPREKARARRRAKQQALRLGKTRGIDVARELGEEYLDLWVSRLVNRQKQQAR